MIIFSCLIILYLVLAIRHYGKKHSKKRNFYIEEHQKNTRNHIMYKDYLKWCENNHEIPMNKQVYLKDIDIKEKSIKKLI